MDRDAGTDLPRRVLFVVPDMHTPPAKGYQVRCLAMAGSLSPRFITRIVSARTARTVENLAADRRPLDRARALVGRVLDGRPIQSALFDGLDVAERVRRLAEDWQPDAIVVVTERLPVTIDLLCEWPLIVDAVDSMEQQMSERASRAIAGVAYLWKREAGAFRRNAKSISRCASRVLVCSDTARGYHPTAHVIENGAPAYASPRPVSTVDLVFSGNLSYWPNVRAALVICELIAPRVLAALPHARIAIAGHNPRAEVKRACQRAGVELLPNVSDMGSILRSSRLALAPLEWTPGANLKILEALSAGTPVLAYRTAAQQVPRDEGIRVCDGPDDMADQAVAFLQGVLDFRPGDSARFTWASRAKDLERILDEIITDRDGYSAAARS